MALSVGLAFLFGYGLTPRPLLASGVLLAQAARRASAAVTVSTAVVEIVDNGVMLAVPGAMEAGLEAPLVWSALVFALAIASVAAFPVNSMAHQAGTWARRRPRAPRRLANGRGDDSRRRHRPDRPGFARRRGGHRKARRRDPGSGAAGELDQRSPASRPRTSRVSCRA